VTELLIPFLTFVAILALGGAALTAAAARRQLVQERLSRLSQQATAAAPLSESSFFLRFLSKIGKMVSSKEPSISLREQLARAGYHHDSAPTIYLGSKILLLLVGLIGVSLAVLPIQGLIMPVRLLIILWCGGLVFLAPNVVVSMRRARRRREIANHLPDAIDLLEICVSAGMGLDMAWNSVSDEISGVCPTLADEMALTNLEIHLGAPRAAALRHMADRTGADDISSLVSTLVQSERFGTSIADALKAFANSMREIRSARAEESAEKMPVKLLFPLVLFLFPAVLIVIAGPAVIEWMNIMANS
jgi:tight adherence protein C